jgi:acyl dehydratase
MTKAAKDGDRALTGVPVPMVLRLDELDGYVGKVLGHSAWREITQADVDTFARLTGDEQYIHIDPALAAQGPFGVTIAHGFMTLSWFTGMLWEIAVVEGAETILNYGLNRVRFPAPAPVGGLIRLKLSIDEVKQVDRGIQVVYGAVFELAAAPKPVCVAEVVFRYYPPVVTELPREQLPSEFDTG